MSRSTNRGRGASADDLADNGALLGRDLKGLHADGIRVIDAVKVGASSLSRHGIEEYVPDCVMLLDHRVTEELSTRRLRVLRYRGLLWRWSTCP